MDLIDRAALKKAWHFGDDCLKCEQDTRKCNYDLYYTRMDVCGMLDDAPTVPAVPLDKLCEWLANSFSDPPCCTLENVRCKIECRGFTQMDFSECWRHVLNKWMEGQHE